MPRRSFVLSDLESRLAPGEWLFSMLFEKPDLAIPSEGETNPAIGTSIPQWLGEKIDHFEIDQPISPSSRASEFHLVDEVRFDSELMRDVPSVQFVPAAIRSSNDAPVARKSFDSMSSQTRDSISVSSTPPFQSPKPESFSLKDQSTKPVTESSNLPSASPPKPTAALATSFTNTEIMIGIRGSKSDALKQLGSSELANQFDLESSYVILESDGISLTFAALRPDVSVLDTVERVKAETWEVWAEPNQVMEGDARELTPNDTNWTNAGQYYHTLSQTNLAWDITTGNSNVIVAVTDEGVGYNHPDLAGNIWSNPAEASGSAGVDDDNNGFIDDIRGWDFSSNDNNPLPTGSDTHGTHVSGIVAARTNNATGVAGTAGGNGTTKGISIMPVRWDGSASWTAAIVANSFAYAANNGAQIITSSYNFDGFAGSNTVNSAFNYSYGKGVLQFISAGNNNELDAPRRVFEQPLFVASEGSTNVKSSFSNYGAYVDIAGNGDNIFSTTTSSNGTGVSYSTLSGTSMSTPHAAGVAALILSQNPTWTRDQVAAQMLGMADVVDSSNPTFLNRLGTGRVNAYRALTETLPAPRFGRVTGLPADGMASATFSSFTLFQPMRFRPNSVIAANFELRNAGIDNQFETGDDSVVPLTINGNASIFIGTDSFTFAKSGGGSFDVGKYRFTALSGATQLRDPFDQPLDGNSDGLAGGNYVREFTILGASTNSISGTIFEDGGGDGIRQSYDAALTGPTQSLVYLDRNNNGTRDTTATSFSSTGGPLTIPASGRIFMPLTVTGLTSPTIDVDVKLNITHPRLGDLDVFLVSPSGVRVELATDVGASGANFVNTVLNDSATSAITAGTAPFTNSYRPEIPLSNFNNQSANGGWLLEVVDDNPTALAGTMQVNDFSVIVSTAEDLATPDAAGNYAFAGLTPGDYVVRSLAATGWVSTGPAGILATVPANGTATNIDFGTSKNGRVYSRVFHDVSENGIWDSGEAGISGRQIFADMNGNGIRDSETNTVSNSTVLSIPDAGAAVYSNITVSNLVGIVTDLNVTVNITHEYDADLNIFLVSPTGIRVELATNVGGEFDNFTNTIFDDEAATAITSGSAPFTGSFRPEGLLSAVDGQVVNGIWRLEIQDVGAIDLGQLNKWSMTFASSEPFTTSNSLGNAFIDLANGSYDVRNPAVAGWRPTNPTSSSYSVTVNSAPVYDRSFAIVADTNPPVIASTKVGTGAAQRSRVESVTLTMNELVTFTGSPTAAISINKTGGGSVTPIVAIDNSGPATILTITFADNTLNGSIVDGDYTIALDGTQIRDLAQNLMGGSATSPFHRLFGDGNGDRTVNGVDLSQIRFTFGSTTANSNFNVAYDYNNDGTINGIDLSQFRSRFGSSVP